MKEQTSRTTLDSSLPPIRLSTLTKAPSQHKLDTLLKEISQVPSSALPIKTAPDSKSTVAGESKGRTLLRSVNSFSRMGLKSKYERSEKAVPHRLDGLKGKVEERGKINLTSVSCMAPTVETDSVRVSAQIIETDLLDFSP